MKNFEKIITVWVIAYTMLSLGWMFIQTDRINNIERDIAWTQTTLRKYQEDIDSLKRNIYSIKENVVKFIETKDDLSTYLNSPIINDIQITPDFNLREFADKRTGEVKISPRLIYICQKLRNRAGPLWVTSGYRSEKTNMEVGGVENSLHLKGMAVDLVPLKVSIKELSEIAKQFPEITEIGIYRFHLHIGIGKGKRRIWYSLKP